MRLLDNSTIHFIPFRLHNSDNILSTLDHSNMWRHMDTGFKNHALYSHVYDFLCGQGTKVNDFGCRIYDFRKENTPLNDILNGRVMKVRCKREDGTIVEFDFNFCGGAQMDAPRIIIYPQASIGIFSYAVRLNDRYKDTDDLLAFNYCFHKLGKDQASLVQMNIDETKWKAMNPDGKEHPHKRLANNLYNAISMTSYQELNGFYMWQFYRYMLLELNLTDDCFFNIDRTHQFAYARIDKAQDIEQFKRMFIRLTKIQNGNYNVQTENTPARIIEQTFENVFIGSCSEGGAIAVIASEDAPNHLKDFRKVDFIPKYLWSYLLVLIQRYTLIALADMLTNPDVDKNLSTFVKKLSRLKMSTSMIDISNYTHQNQFYSLCINNLKIRKYFEDVSEKLDSLNSILDRLRDQAELEKAEIEKQQNEKLNRSLAILTSAQIFFSAVAFFTTAPCNFKPPFWMIIVLSIPTLYFIYIAIMIWINIKKNKSKK